MKRLLPLLIAIPLLLGMGSRPPSPKPPPTTPTTPTTPTVPTVPIVPPAPPLPPPSSAAIFLSPTGSDSAACTASAPCKTFARAWTLAVPGSDISAADGTYGDASPPVGKSGTETQPIAVRSATPGGARISSIGFRGSAYIAVSGFRIDGKESAVAVVSNGTGQASHHITFREIGFSCTPGTLNDGACFDLSDGTHHVTLEDSWGWGGGRYTILCYGGPGGSPKNLTCDSNTFRRLVLRQGPTKSSAGAPQASLALYYAGSNLVEDVVAIDGTASSDTSNSAFYITGHAPPPNSDGNRFNRVVAVNNLGVGFYLDCGGAVCNAVDVRNSLFWGSGQGGVAITGGTCTGAVIDHVTAGANKGHGFENYACTGATLTASAFVGNVGAGARQSPSAGSTTGRGNGYFGNGATVSGMAAGAGDVTTAVTVTNRAAAPWPGIGATIDLSWLGTHEARRRAEMCATVKSGACAASSTVDYLRGP
jgi:hypothetical protein